MEIGYINLAIIIITIMANDTHDRIIIEPNPDMFKIGLRLMN